ncbi:hypothetical protein ABZ467_24700 [Streptomyces sp. NPDC005727]|uniref:hypothetical protein n=1 Tax=Streptomyces sp. NPDC005727 TaxID=3157053 RepID=UPI0033E33571
MTTGEHRPGDAAREALRAARRRTDAARIETAPDPESPAPTTAPAPGTADPAHLGGKAGTCYQRDLALQQ